MNLNSINPQETIKNETILSWVLWITTILRSLGDSIEKDKKFKLLKIKLIEELGDLKQELYKKINAVENTRDYFQKKLTQILEEMWITEEKANKDFQDAIISEVISWFTAPFEEIMENLEQTAQDVNNTDKKEELFWLINKFIVFFNELLELLKIDIAEVNQIKEEKEQNRWSSNSWVTLKTDKLQ